MIDEQSKLERDIKASMDLAKSMDDLRAKLASVSLIADDLANNNAIEEKELNRESRFHNRRDEVVEFRNDSANEANARRTNLGASHDVDDLESNESRKKIEEATDARKFDGDELSKLFCTRRATIDTGNSSEQRKCESAGVDLSSFVDEPNPALFSSQKGGKRTVVHWKSEIMPLESIATMPSTRPKDKAAMAAQRTWGPTATSSKASNVEWFKKAFSLDRYANTSDACSSTVSGAGETLAKVQPTSALDDVQRFLVPGGYAGEDESKESRAIWLERCSLSKAGDSCSSSVSDEDGEELSGNEDQVQASNPSSQESENEQRDETRRKKKWKRSSKLRNTQEGAENEDEEDEDEGHIDDDASSLASTTSCSEDSFEIGTIVDPSTTITSRSVKDYAHVRRFPPSSSLNCHAMGVEKLPGGLITEESSLPNAAPASCLGSIGEIEEGLKNDNNSFYPSFLRNSAKSDASEGNNVLVQAPSGVTAPSNQMSSLEAVPLKLGSSAPSSPGLFSSTATDSSTSLARRNITEELSSLDTGLPQLDFEKLEKQLTDAAKEREMNQRKLMSEHVLHRLTTDSGDQPRYHPPPATKRPLKSNLGARLQSGMNLQVCFMNDAAPGDDDDDEVEWGDNEDECGNVMVPKSRSTPNLGEPCGSNKAVGRSVSNCSDSTKRASDLRMALLERHNSEDKDFEKRQARLEEETKLMLSRAKEAAHMQMEMERQKGKAAESVIDKVVGVENLGRRKLTRLQLTKMCITQLQIILNDMHSKVEALNEELVQLLMERDSLHMEQDSLLVDIEDLLQHQRCVDLRLPDFLIADPMSGPCFTNNNGSGTNAMKSNRFRIFKR